MWLDWGCSWRVGEGWGGVGPYGRHGAFLPSPFYAVNARPARNSFAAQPGPTPLRPRPSVQVTRLHSFAFPLAEVAVAVMAAFPEFVDLLVARLHQVRTLGALGTLRCASQLALATAGGKPHLHGAWGELLLS